VKLVFVGAGPYKDKLAKLATELDVLEKVIFVGQIPEDSIQCLYNIADVVVVPSIGTEALSMVVVEGMSAGKPVIASNIGGIPTAIEHLKNGILVDPGNPKNLAGIILEVITNDELAQNLGMNARKTAMARFTVERMVKDTIGVYEEVCKL
jgi:glycosyltransferase involved in cell wall biosynthesis